MIDHLAAHGILYIWGAALILAVCHKGIVEQGATVESRHRREDILTSIATTLTWIGCITMFLYWLGS